MSGAARTQLGPRTARAPGVPDPSRARSRPLDYCAHRTTTTCALPPRAASPSPLVPSSPSAPDPPGPVRPDSPGTDLPTSLSIARLRAPPRSRSRLPGLHPLLAWISWDHRARAFFGARRADPPAGARSPAGAARRGSARLPEPAPAMARARPPPPPPPPPGLLPLLSPLLLLPLLLPSGCRALEGERRRGARPRVKVSGVARAWAGKGPRCWSDAGWAHFGGGSVTRALSGGRRMGWGGRPRRCLGGSSYLCGRQSAGCGIAGSSTRESVPRKSWPGRELLREYPALRAEERGPGHLLEARKCGRPTRQGGGSEADAGLWRVEAKRDSPG